MTIDELDNEFDILYNSITSNQAPALDKYEKSVFLTYGQEDVIKSYFSAKHNKVQEGFDDSLIRQVNLSKLIATKNITEADFKDISNAGSFDGRANNKVIEGIEDALVILNEHVYVDRLWRNNGGIEGRQRTRLILSPITYVEYMANMNKPYTRPTKNIAWKLILNGGKYEIIPGPTDEIKEYIARYIKRPMPIILNGIEDSSLSINGQPCDISKGCSLDQSLHRDVLKRAVELAKAAYTGDLSTQISIGNSSQTDIGVVPQSS